MPETMPEVRPDTRPIRLRGRPLRAGLAAAEADFFLSHMRTGSACWAAHWLLRYWQILGSRRKSVVSIHSSLRYLILRGNTFVPGLRLLRCPVNQRARSRTFAPRRAVRAIQGQRTPDGEPRTFPAMRYPVAGQEAQCETPSAPPPSSVGNHIDRRTGSRDNSCCNSQQTRDCRYAAYSIASATEPPSTSDTNCSTQPNLHAPTDGCRIS